MEKKTNEIVDKALCIAGRVFVSSGFMPIVMKPQTFNRDEELDKRDFAAHIQNLSDKMVYSFSFMSDFAYYSIKVNDVKPFDEERRNCGLFFILKIRRTKTLVSKSPQTILKESFDKFKERYLLFENGRYSFKKNPYDDDEKDEVITLPLEGCDLDDAPSFSQKGEMCISEKKGENGTADNIGVISIKQGEEENFFGNLRYRNEFKPYKEIEVGFDCEDEVSDNLKKIRFDMSVNWKSAKKKCPDSMGNIENTSKFNLNLGSSPNGVATSETGLAEDGTDNVKVEMQTTPEPTKPNHDNTKDKGGDEKTTAPSIVERKYVFYAAAACFVLGLILTWILYPIFNPPAEPEKPETYRDLFVKYTNPGSLAHAQKLLDSLNADLRTANTYFNPEKNVENANMDSIQKFKTSVKITDWNGLAAASDAISKMVKQIPVPNPDEQFVEQKSMYEYLAEREFVAAKATKEYKNLDDKLKDAIDVIETYNGMYQNKTNYRNKVKDRKVLLSSVDVIVKERICGALETYICDTTGKKIIYKNIELDNFTNKTIYNAICSNSKAIWYVDKYYNNKATNIVNFLFPNEMNVKQQLSIHNLIEENYKTSGDVLTKWDSLKKIAKLN